MAGSCVLGDHLVQAAKQSAADTNGTYRDNCANFHSRLSTEPNVSAIPGASSRQ